MDGEGGVCCEAVRTGLIELPAPRNGNGNDRALRIPRVALRAPPAQPLRGTVGDLAGLHVAAVADKAASRWWNGLIARWRYLCYQPLPGAQLSYLIRCEAGLLGAIVFSAAVWKVAGISGIQTGPGGIDPEAFLGHGERKRHHRPASRRVIEQPST